MAKALMKIKKLLSVRSERIKSVEFHPTEPWILASLYSGQAIVWNYETQATVKTFEVCDAPGKATDKTRYHPLNAG